MRKLSGYDEGDKRRIVTLASMLVENLIETGEISCTEEAIKEVMPQAIEDARRIVTAANESLY